MNMALPKEVAGRVGELVIANLSKTYGNGVRALDNVSMTVPRGMFGLLGANGAGKTTLMNIIATLVRPDSGSLHLGGVDALRDPMAMRRSVGYLPQEFGVYPGVSAVTLLDHFAILKGIASARERRRHVGELLELVNLDDAKHRAVDTYSGGMRRRFGVAQALIGWPPLVVVDEPTAGLDPLERNRFQHVLNEIGNSTIVILSTHIVEDVANICTSSAIMDEGRVVATGAPDELIAHLRGRVWRKTMSREEAGNFPNALSAHPFKGRVRVSIVSVTPPGSGFETYEPDLEDVFYAAKAGFFTQ